MKIVLTEKDYELLKDKSELDITAFFKIPLSQWSDMQQHFWPFKFLQEQYSKLRIERCYIKTGSAAIVAVRITKII